MARIVILMYHIIDWSKAERESKYCCLPLRFAQQMEYLSKSGYSLINLNDVADILDGDKSIDSDAVAVTFDDGFEDFYRNAFPILSRFNVPATLFMVSDRIGGDNDWMHCSGSPKRKLLSQSELSELADNGILIGSHTRTHPKLNEISGDKSFLYEEIHDSKCELENKLGCDIQHFAYPYGLFDDTAVESVKQSGYRTACSTRSGFNRSEIDPFLLRRIEVFGSDRLWHFKQKLKFGTNDMSVLFPLRYYFSRAKSNLFASG